MTAKIMHVIYEWEVPEVNREAFFKCWEETTLAIHEKVDGALGSFCVASYENSNKVLTIAKWESRSQWLAFIDTAQSGPMKQMHKLAKQISYEGFEEMGNNLKPAAE